MQSNGKATAALVCGILAILFSWTIILGIGLGIAAIILAVKAVKESGKDGKSTGGKVCGIVGIVFSVITLIIVICLVAFGVALFNDPDFQDAYHDAYNSAQSDSTYGSGSSSSNGSSSSSGSGSSSSSTTHAATTDDEKAAQKVVTDYLDTLKAGDAASLNQVATDTDSALSGSGMSLSALGILPSDLTGWLAKDMTYTVTDVSASGTYSSVVVSVTSHDVVSLIEASTNSLDSADTSSITDEAAVYQLLGTYMLQARDTTPATTKTIYFDLSKSGDTWTIDDSSKTYALDSIYIYGC